MMNGNLLSALGIGARAKICCAVAVSASLSLASFLMFVLTAHAAAAFSTTTTCGFAEPDQVIIYQQQNRGGACRVLGVGTYANASAFGLPNDSITAIDVGFNVRAVLYHDPPFRGLAAHYEGGFYYDPLGNVDNQTSSIEIFPRQGGPAATWYLGDYPDDGATFWSNDSQGLANDGANWFITKGYNSNNTKLFKVPLSYDLNNSSEGTNPSTGIPIPLKNQGYDHFGDIDQSRGFVFVPVENQSNHSSKPVTAVFSTVDLRFLSSFELSDNPNNSADWVAIRSYQGERTLWISGGTLSENNKIREYDIDWDRLEVNGLLLLSFRRQLNLQDRNGATLALHNLQGGVFNPEGTLLYLSSGYCDTFGYIDVFTIEDSTNTALLQASSEDGYGPFNFESVPAPTIFGACQGDEAEGLDWLDVQDLSVPGIPDGQLHAIVVDNKLFTSDKVYLKHYSY
jgi:hypothetical protein